MSWQLGSLIVVAIALLAGFRWYEGQRPPARVVSLVAALAALAVVGRLAFVAFPNVKPTTDIVLFAGYALGAAPGFAVGAVTAIASNVFLGQGPWTVWQMLSWGGVGVGGALLARAARGRELGRLPLAIACAAAGLLFGAVMDVYQWTFTARQTPESYFAVAGTSLPYNLAHAAGNFVFCLAIGPPFIRALRRYRRRFEVRWEAPRGSVAVTCALAALALGGGLAAASPADAASSAARAARYLERAQNRDGGFGGARGQASSQLYSGWTALGLASARRSPASVRRRGGRTAIQYIRAQARSLGDTGELERTILVLRAAGLSPRRFAGRNLVSQLIARRRGDGSWGGLVNQTAFGVLALRAARAGRLSRSATFLARAQNGDGGFGYTARAPSDVDDTGAVLQALAAARRGRSGSARRAVSYLRRAQNGDGGFGQMAGRSSNAQSTAWAVQGLVAARARGRTVSRAVSYLRALQRRNGSIRYSRSSSQTPVWVTAQALTALRRSPFPLRAVPRRRGSKRSAAAGTREDGGRSDRTKEGAATGPSATELATRAAARAHALAAGRPVAARNASARRREEEGGTPAGLIAAGGAAVLALLALARWRLKRRVAAG